MYFPAQSKGLSSSNSKQIRWIAHTSLHENIKLFKLLHVHSITKPRVTYETGDFKRELLIAFYTNYGFLNGEGGQFSGLLACMLHHSQRLNEKVNGLGKDSCEILNVGQ